MPEIEKTKDEFKKLHDEWIQYHEGKVTHPTKNEDVSKAEIRQLEISDIVQKQFDDLKKSVGKKTLKVEHIEPYVYNLAEKSYLAQQGIKDKKVVESDILKQNVKTYFIHLASEIAGQSFDSYEEAIESILEAADPIHGKSEADRSRILDALIENYAQLTHVSEHEGTKGQSWRRLQYLTQELTHMGHKEHWESNYGNIFEDYGRKGHKFHKRAKSGDILNVVQEALTNDKLSGNTLRRKYITNPKGPLKEAKPYHK